MTWDWMLIRVIPGHQHGGIVGVGNIQSAEW